LHFDDYSIQILASKRFNIYTDVISLNPGMSSSMQYEYDE